MTDMNYAGIIRGAMSLNQYERYEDGSTKEEIAGKIIIYFHDEPAVESVEIPIIFENGSYFKKGTITIGRNGRHSFKFE